MNWKEHQHLDAERSVLAAMILGADAIEKATRVLRPESFKTTAHSLVFDSIAALHARGVSVDLITLSDELQRCANLDRVGGPQYLASLMSAAVTSANVEAHAGIVLRAAQQRDLKSMALAIAGDLEADLLPADLQERLERMRELAAFREKNRVPRTLSEIYAQMETVGVPTHVPLGFEKFHDLFISPGELFVIGARPGGGKTAMLTTIASNAASAGWQSLFLSLEMDATLIGTRLQQSGTPADARIWVEDDPALTDMGLISAYSKAFVGTYPDRPTVILVDYAQLIRPRGRFDRRHEAIGQVCRDLKLMARSLEVPVIVGAQLSRAMEQRGKDSKPQLSDLRESGEIENTADEVMLLHRDDRRTYAKLAKYRMGKTFTAEIFFNPQRTTFEDHEWA